jgi:hypothetical protein
MSVKDKRFSYKLPFLKESTTITMGPNNTIMPKEISCPMTCQLIIFEFLNLIF